MGPLSFSISFSHGSLFFLTLSFFSFSHSSLVLNERVISLSFFISFSHLSRFQLVLVTYLSFLKITIFSFSHISLVFYNSFSHGSLVLNERGISLSYFIRFSHL